jgi:hypothetical protein
MKLPLIFIKQTKQFCYDLYEKRERKENKNRKKETE